MSLTTLYWLAFLGYSGIVLGIGLWIYFRGSSARRGADTASFWSANKNLSGWSVGLSISASMMSISWSCVYGVQLFYWYGVGAIWLLIIPWLITMGGFFAFAPVFRRLQAFSQPELLEKRFGSRSRRLLAPALIFVFIVWGGAEIWAAGKNIAPFLGISEPMTLLLIAGVVALYSFTGGFEAVVSTDKLQFTLVALFITVMAALGVYGLGEQGQLSALDGATFLAPRAQPQAPYLFSPGMAVILLTFLAYLPGWLVETDVWIRLQAARSDGEARKGIAITALNSLIFVGMLPLFIGLSALALYPPVEGEIPARLQDGAVIFNVLIADFAPPWLNLLLGIGLVAAAMSTVDTCSNVVALSLSYDVLEPFLRRRGYRLNLQLVARWVSVGAVLLALVYALFTESLWDIFYLSSGILTTTVFLPVVAAFRPSTKAAQVNASVVLGFGGTILFYFLESRGYLAALEPSWLAETGLGYILLG
ncbi:MAG: sodium:solute symporter family protein, partial [Calditrichaeota bacterium]